MNSLTNDELREIKHSLINGENINVLVATILSGIWSGEVKIKEAADKAVDSLQHQLQESIALLKWTKNLAEKSGIEFRHGANQETDRILELTGELDESNE